MKAGMVWCMLMMAAGVAWADTVTLKSGAVIRGEVTAEDAYEVRVVVSRTIDGDLRTERVIAQSQVDRIERGTPDVAVEPSADALAKPDAGSAPAMPDVNPLHEAVQRADELAAAGQYDDAAAAYREAAAEVDKRLAQYPDTGKPDPQGARLAHLEVRCKALDRLVIALKGKLDLKRENLKTVDASANEERDRLSSARRELASLDSKRQDSSMGVPKRLGEGMPAAGSLSRRRNLEAEIARLEPRLKTQDAWSAAERQVIVNLETEIELAAAQAQAAKESYDTAKRAVKVRR